jgi:preprotein translocase subunit SecD
MYTDLKWKVPLIFFVILGAAFLAYPLKDKIALGLDLQGGMHLVLEVQTEKAVEASLERIADDIKREIEKEDYEVDRIRADFENKTITVLMVDAIDLEPVEKIMKSFTAYLKNDGKVREYDPPRNLLSLSHALYRLLYVPNSLRRLFPFELQAPSAFLPASPSQAQSYPLMDMQEKPHPE